MLDPIFSTLRRIEIYRARGAYRAPGAEKIGACPLPSKYTGGLELDRGKASGSLIDSSKTVPTVRERRDRASAKEITVCLDTRALTLQNEAPNVPYTCALAAPSCSRLINGNASPNRIRACTSS
jgi:hypothetical protein